jgi:hypothetical protein
MIVAGIIISPLGRVMLRINRSKITIEMFWILTVDKDNRK